MNIFSQQCFMEIRCHPQALRHSEYATQPAKFEYASLREVAEQHFNSFAVNSAFFAKLDFGVK